MTTNPLMARFVGEPALIEPTLVDRFRACLEAVVAHPRAEDLLAEQVSGDEGFWPEPDSWRAAYRPYVVKDGILQIPVKGVLLHDFPWALGGWATGYDYIWRAFARGCRDYTLGNIKGIALIEDSFGGMVAGCFDAFDKMMALKAESGTPVRAFAHEAAYSAAYAMACTADHIAVSRTGGVGSIGVVTTHVDVSQALDQAGLKITFIHAGKHKVDGNAYEPLPDDVKARIQARIDELYEVFVSAVARGRGMDAQKVRDTEALTFTATQAVSEGLADSIGSLDDAVAAFAADLSSTSGDDEMSNQDKTAVDQAAHDAAVATAREEGRKAGLAEGASAQLARINAILGSDAGKARPKAALSAALKSSMTAEEANAFLADLPEEQPAAAATDEEPTSFEAAMGKDKPDVGATAGKKDGEEQDEVLTSLKSLGLVAE